MWNTDFENMHGDQRIFLTVAVDCENAVRCVEYAYFDGETFFDELGGVIAFWEKIAWMPIVVPEPYEGE